MGTNWNIGHIGASTQLEVAAAWGADRTADPSTWTWTEITTDVRDDPGITIRLGRSDEASTSQPASVTMTLDNSSGDYTADGTSTNWPYVRQGTPIRVRMNPAGSGWQTLFQGYAEGWAPEWPYHASPEVHLEAAGVLGRLGQGQPVLESSLRRDIVADSTTVAYWPCEDLDGANALFPAVGPYFMTWSAPPDLSSDNYFPSSLPIPIVEGSQWRGAVPVSTPGSWSVRFICKFPETDADSGDDGAPICTVFTTGTAAIWSLTYRTGATRGAFQLTVYDSALGALYTSSVFTSYVLDPNTGLVVTITGDQNGSNVDLSYAQSAITADDTYTVGFSTSITSQTCGAVAAVWVNHLDLLNKVAIGHVSAHDSSVPFYEGLDAARAWRGEYIDARLARLEAETSETVDITGYTPGTMGAQTPATTLELLRECETSDGGILYDGLGAGLSYFTRQERENRPPDLTLNATASEVKPAYNPTLDSQRLINRAVVTRKNAETVTYEDKTGNLGSDYAGKYETSVTASYFNTFQAQDDAAWTVNFGTFEGYRHPTITVNLSDSPSLAATVAALTPGMRIDINNLGTALTSHTISGPLSLAIEGIAHRITSQEWVTTFNCSPYDPWEILQLEDADVSPISYVDDSDFSYGDNSLIIVGYPDTYESDDLIVLMASIRNSGTGTVDTPTGWTELFTSGNVSFFGRVVPRETEALASFGIAVTVTFTGGVSGATTMGQTFALRGTAAHRLTDLADVVHASAAQLNSSAQDIDLPALPITEDNCIALCAWWKADDSTLVSNPHSFDDGPVDGSTTTGDDASMGVDLLVQSTATSYSADTATVTGGASAISRGIMLALLPDPTPPPPPQLDTDGSTLSANISASATSMQVTTTGAGPATYVGIGAIDVGNNASVTPALPSGLASKDFLVCVAAIRNSGTGTVDTPIDWNSLLTSGNLSVFGRYYDSSVSAPTVSFTGGVANATTQAVIFALRGVNPRIAEVLDTSTSQLNASAQNMAVPGLVASHDDVLMVIIGWKQDDWTSVAQLSGQFFTEILDAPTTTGDDAGLEIQVREGGFTNAKTVSATSLVVTGGASAISRTMVLAFAPSIEGIWTTDSADYPIDLDVGGIKITATACSDSYSPQTMTISAAPVARTAGDRVQLWRPARLARAAGLFDL